MEFKNFIYAKENGVARITINRPELWTHFALCFTTEDHNEGINAFLQKRKPNFKGK